ncbi:hypothetical protein PHLGIDRAFT_452103 [Phlebiopsis gigantea 11061_1 CR5-6]|uniref:Uncharacterized protein n=1 Tax=Phlebiopsis gigantea (strain 11061_1 CR5-6) TaxID=745531 RepID=A0A0C3S734_PHLG1|nr:hypothetical protein PHLGIDRAFT_452103 [Phlebiopsis gigantea 11061_1 CR5-6]
MRLIPRGFVGMIEEHPGRWIVRPCGSFHAYRIRHLLFPFITGYYWVLHRPVTAWARLGTCHVQRIISIVSFSTTSFWQSALAYRTSS